MTPGDGELTRAGRAEFHGARAELLPRRLRHRLRARVGRVPDRRAVEVGASGRDEAVALAELEIVLRLPGGVLGIVALDAGEAGVDERADHRVAIREPGM